MGYNQRMNSFFEINSILPAFFFLLGLLVGSFLNCVVYRIKENKSFLKGFSFCPSCFHRLEAKDLFPILSFFFLKGKCRYCKQRISFQYPLVELVTGLLFLAVFLSSDGAIPLIFSLIIFSFFIVIFVYDLKYYLIPDKVIYPAIGAAAVYQAFSAFDSFGWNPETLNVLLPYILSGLGLALFFFSIWFVSRGKWIGFGDVKLGFLIGLFLGFPGVAVALFLGCAIGAIIGVGLIALKKKSLKSEVPFGPFLAVGTLISYFFCEKIVSWYLNFLGI